MHIQVEVGDIVLWHPCGDRQVAPFPALVTGIGNEAIALNVFSRGIQNMWSRDGVRHISDPKARHTEFQENGAWSHTPQAISQARRIAELESLLNGITQPSK